MSTLNAALDSLLNNLTQLIVYKYHLVADVKQDFEALSNELQNLKGMMNDFANYYEDDSYLKQLVREIRIVVDQAEDAVDTYVVGAAVKRSKGFFPRFAYQPTDHRKMLRETGKMVEEVCQKVKKIFQDKEELGYAILQYQAIQKPRQAPREAPWVEEEHVIGFDRSAKKVSALLTGGPEQFEVISIVGMLGLGKTTLAIKVYRAPDVDYEFMIRVFVCVSKEYEKREVYLQILRSFTKNRDEVSKMNEEQLGKHLYQQLEGKQYLIVLDDVWEAEDWDKLKEAFPKNNRRCRILITTRNENVAKLANPHNPKSLFKLEPLNMEESRELLRWRVFRENNCPMVLQEYERQIVKKCDGLPLSIVVIAGILVNHRDRVDWWKDVATSVKDYIARDAGQIIKVIELVYKYLPNHLKQCFLYLGVFSEDFEIPTWKLVRLWIAEGFIEKQSNLDLENTAEFYLEELAYRNLMVVGERGRNGKIKNCRLQSTLREFCKHKAMEENLFQEIKKHELSLFLSGNQTLNQYRRLCINNANILEHISERPSGKSVRSLLTLNMEETKLEPKLLSSFPKAFKLLRVLEAQSLIFIRFPVDLCNLVLLKYIAISSHISILPPALSVLWNLQTLIVNTTSPTLEIKADIWQMLQFRHLHTNASTKLPCPSIKNKKKKEYALLGQNIRTLCTISPESCKEEVFHQTPELKKLSIRGSLIKLFEGSSESSSFGYLQRLKLLDNLKFLNDEGSQKLAGLLSEKSFPSELRSLTLSNTQLDWKEMSKLGKLGNLEVLKLKDNAFQGKSWQTEEGCFPSLKHLHIENTDLEVWWTSANDFAELRSLELNRCHHLDGIPLSFADNPNLQLVVLHRTNPQVATSARKLQKLKLKQAENDNKKASFKLSVYPPEH